MGAVRKALLNLNCNTARVNTDYFTIFLTLTLGQTRGHIMGCPLLVVVLQLALQPAAGSLWPAAASLRSGATLRTVGSDAAWVLDGARCATLSDAVADAMDGRTRRARGRTGGRIRFLHRENYELMESNPQWVAVKMLSAVAESSESQFP